MRASRAARRQLQELYGHDGFRVIGKDGKNGRAGTVQYRHEGKWHDSPVIIPGPGSPGRPRILEPGGVNLRVYMSKADKALARILGKGNIAEGVRVALRHAFHTDPRRHHSELLAKDLPRLGNFQPHNN